MRRKIKDSRVKIQVSCVLHLVFCPSLDLIIVQNPGGGAYLKVVPDPDLRALIPQDMHLRERKLLKQIVDSCI